jgi:hypothetical protein
VKKEVLKKHHIGLLIVSNNSVYEEMAPKRKNPKDQFKYQIAAETAWKQFIRINSTFGILNHAWKIEKHVEIIEKIVERPKLLT